MIAASCLCKSVRFELRGELRAPRYCFCATCGAPVWFESKDNDDVVMLPLGVFDNGDLPSPEMHIWVASKPGWCAIHDDLPQFATYPGQ